MSQLENILSEADSLQGLIAYAVVEIESGKRVAGRTMDPNFPLDDACGVFANVVRTWASCFKAVNAGNADIGQYCTDRAAVVTRILPGGTHYLGYAVARDSLKQAADLALKLTADVSKNL